MTILNMTNIKCKRYIGLLVMEHFFGQQKERNLISSLVALCNLCPPHKLTYKDPVINVSC